MLYIHNGLPKAGSTFLQKWFVQNQEVVRQHEQNLPTNHFLSGLGHYPLFSPLLSGQGGVSEHAAASFRQTWTAFLAFNRNTGQNISNQYHGALDELLHLYG